MSNHFFMQFPWSHSPFDQHDWYYLDDMRKQHGPHTFAEINKFFDKSQITEEIYVWNETMENWQKIKDQPELLKVLKNQPGH